MPTPAQIDEQIQFERDAIRLGLERLRKNTKDLESKSYASASVYGCSSIATLLPLVTKRIEETKKRIREGYIGKAFKDIHEFLDPISSGAAASIACKITFDKVFSYKDDANKLIKVCEAIGIAVEQEAQMQFYEKNCPGLLHVLKKNYWLNTTGTQQKFTVIKTLINRYDNVPKWTKWRSPELVKLGNWLLDCVMLSSGWFDKETIRKGRKTDNFIVPTPEFLRIKDEVMANAELFSPIAYPMLVEPNDWTNTRQGGYILNEVMRGYDLVRRGAGPIQGETPIQFLNKVQKVGYQLNSFTLEVAKTLMEKGRTVGKFIPVVEYDLPSKPVDIATNKEARFEYRKTSTEIRNKNAASFKKSCRTRMTMEAAKLFEGKEFFIPHSFDYRGRIYPIPAFLTPQDTDFGKSLLKFSEPGFMTPYAEEWLAFQVATTYGLDKKTMLERLSWVKDNIHLIASIAEDPLGRLPEWEVADEPWQFLAACDEYYHCVLKCDRDFTSLPVATDATCSGIQILAGLCRDATTASLVNVLPGTTPADAYATVAEHAKPNIPIIWREHVDRGVAKRLVMTIPYNAKFKSNWQYVNKALNFPKDKGGKELNVPKDDVTIITHALRDAAFELFPGPMKAMKWIEDQVKVAMKRGDTQLEWVTPSGFIVTQVFQKKLFERVTLQLLGRVDIRVATEDSDTVDKNHHKNATSPNLIHSLDASLLCLSTLRFDAPIALIHDSVLCRATDMSALSAIVREVYMHIFSETSYLESWAQQIGAELPLPDGLIIGDLEPDSVIESTYFFC